MYKYGKILIQKYFDEQSFVDSDIESFNSFMEKELNIILEENKEIVPTIIPHNIDDFKIEKVSININSQVIGRGTFGKVYLVKSKAGNNNELYAMKVLKKE